MPGVLAISPNQIDHARTDRRFTAGQPDLVDAQAGRHTHQRDDLVIGHQFLARAKLHLFGHAVDAAQVADIGQADAQIVDAATVAVCHRLNRSTCVRRMDSKALGQRGHRNIAVPLVSTVWFVLK